MLKVKVSAKNSNQTVILVEGEYGAIGGRLTRGDIERAAMLPENYTVGTYTEDENFWYKVLEV